MSDLVKVKCCRCNDAFGMSQSTYNTYKRNNAIWHCPHGHQQHFVEGESEAEKLRRELDRQKQNNAYWKDRVDTERKRVEAAQRSASAFKGQVTKMKNRAKAGVCPCCNRTFQNLARHMQSQHPEFDPVKEAENVVKLKA